MAEKTLIERVKEFSKVKLKKASVKVPRLKNPKKLAKPIFLSKVKEDKTPTSSIINILIKMAIEQTKKERNFTKMRSLKSESLLDDKGKSYTTLKKDRDVVSGYGAVSKVYGGMPRASYVDYGKLFSYLGKFKSQSPYENMAEHVDRNSNSSGDSTFSLIDNETMDKGARYVKYFSGGQDMNTVSLVPMAGMNSAEWEQFKLWMKLDPVMYRLKTSIS